MECEYAPIHECTPPFIDKNKIKNFNGYWLLYEIESSEKQSPRAHTRDRQEIHFSELVRAPLSGINVFKWQKINYYYLFPQLLFYSYYQFKIWTLIWHSNRYKYISFNLYDVQHMWRMQRAQNAFRMLISQCWLHLNVNLKDMNWQFHSTEIVHCVCRHYERYADFMTHQEQFEFSSSS